MADSQKILAAARKAIRAQQQGDQVVMVVSAMGKNTDMLVSLASEISERPPAREMDMLLSTGEQVSVALMAMAIDSLGHKAVSLTGAQIGIKTDSTHTKARIQSISTERMQRLLDDGNIVIAAGFQGIDEDFNITTLGRGGSDTTAVALAAVLHADACEIYTDVDGVYTTDPRVLPEARRVTKISYDEMLELASLGAGVMHSRSIEFGKKYGVPIHVRSSMTDTPGTIIVDHPESLERGVSGAAITKDEARITITDVPDRPGSSFEVFSRIASRKITVDMIVQNVGREGKANISFTVPRDELDLALEAINEATQVLGGAAVNHDDQVSKVSVVGLGMATQTGVADRMFRALAESDVNIEMITTSEIKISVLVQREIAQKALRVVHGVFDLATEPPGISIAREDSSAPRADAAEVVSHLQGFGMEDLFIDDMTLDVNQSRVSINGVPDTPGVAAQVFEEIAAAGIFIDMIVQGFGGKQFANLSFTVPRDSLQDSIKVAQELANRFACHGVSHSESIAKLSVSGVGLRSHTDVAIRTFKSLADAGINVEMVNTSEVSLNVAVDGAKGELGLECLKQAFADVVQK